MCTKSISREVRPQQAWEVGPAQPRDLQTWGAMARREGEGGGWGQANLLGHCLEGRVLSRRDQSDVCLGQADEAEGIPGRGSSLGRGMEILQDKAGSGQ